MASRTAILVLRFLSLILLAASLAIIAADKLTISFDPLRNITFKDVHAYRYLLAAAVIGCTYTLLHLPFAVAGVARGNKPAATAALVVVLVDVAFAMTLATGAPRGSASPTTRSATSTSFFDLAYVSSGLMLAAAACTALMIMISVYSLVKSSSV
ncbi:hypothetical protein HU200_038236 [Digitaria exilis]|uniref:CASP-like protein n=1 Tax=Digitaria exilis TaxID=1010633 RepID=A0A835BIZ7_9POAL|nr:hypothetical protein HU200_038236 [Digitaria exilis]